MNIAIDDSPLSGKHMLAHRVRGTGFYLENLKTALEKFYPNNTYTYFTHIKNISNKIDLVHYPYFEPFFITLPFNYSIPTVVTIHDLTPLVFPRNFPAGIKGWIKWNIQKTNLKNISAVITDSESSKKDILKYTTVPNDKVHVIYLASSEDFKQIKEIKLLNSVREKYQLPKDFILYVGDATWNKNLPRLVKATQKSNIPLILVGKALKETNFDKKNQWNKDLAEVQELIARDKKIISLGFVLHDELIALYNLATAFIMPSLYEGFGLPLLEAMSCGCPVITTREGSIPEVVGESAFFVDANNIDSITNGIKRVFAEKQLQESLSKKGLEQKNKFSWKKTAEGTISVYESILGRK